MIIPDTFTVPTTYKFNIIDDNQSVFLRPLNRDIADEDFFIVSSNRKHLKGLFGELDDWWPSDNLTEKDNYDMLLWHEQEFIKKNSFAYSIHLNNQYIGCLYIYGLEEVRKIVTIKGNMLYVFMWTIESIYLKGIDELIFKHLKNWIERVWNFASVDYPGRTTPLFSHSKNTASWIKTI